MPSGSVTPAGGGTAFNGGTITGALDIQAQVAAGGDLLRVTNTAGGAGATALRVLRTPGGANAVVLGTTGFNNGGKFWADWDNDNSPTLEVGQSAGVIKMVGLPTSDPGVSGQLYTLTGVLKVSP